MKQLNISWRLYSLVLLTLIILASAMIFSLFQSYNQSVRERRSGIAYMNDAAISVFKRYHDLELAGGMTRDEAQSEAKAAISGMRYADGWGYFFVLDFQTRMLVQPIRPEMVGRDFSNEKDAHGKPFFQDLTKTAKSPGKGYVDYYWPKPGSDKPIEKFAHVAGFEPWGWAVVTGIYVDDLQTMFYGDAVNFAIIFVISSTLLLGAATLVVRSVVGPIASIKAALGSIACGEVGIEIPCTDQNNELGQMAAALSKLRDSVEERAQLQIREVDQARALAHERSRNEQATLVSAERQARAMAALGHALESLSAGDLSVSLLDLGDDYAKIRNDFNSSMSSLRQTIGSISETSLVVRDNAADISSATGDLSRRTEQQAAALEETAAALDQITATVRTSSDRAHEARTMVSETKESAGRSGAIVRNAIAAMGRIEESSNRINQIISVIDEIAFQTNLLALNAGVEAARAGEAGRGFAVVAQEVRDLAQRSANAAKEIKTLIGTSAREVEGGVRLVRSTGDALLEITALVDRVNSHVDTIATAAREQATGLQEINSSVNHMDQMTQKNAAMVEETTAASQTLAEQSIQLQRLLSAFHFEAKVNRFTEYSRAA